MTERVAIATMEASITLTPPREIDAAKRSLNEHYGWPGWPAAPPHELVDASYQIHRSRVVRARYTFYSDGTWDVEILNADV